MNLFIVILTASIASTKAWVPTTRQSGASKSVMQVSNILEEVDEVVSTIEATPVQRHAIKHKRWGVDNQHGEEYWFDSRIHTFGNVGFLGAVHAALAPVSTKVIDDIAYDGTDVRKMVAEELAKSIRRSKARVLDLCCGTGFSTRALQNAFPDADAVIGVDTSPEMLAMAKFITKHLHTVKPFWDKFGEYQLLSKFLPNPSSQNVAQPQGCPLSATFQKGNAENTPFPQQSFDLVTIMYAFHETPKHGRAKILKEVNRLLQPGGTLVILDIASDYVPSKQMLMGEPFVQEYQRNIHKQLRNQKGFVLTKYKPIVKGHVGMWILRRSKLLAI